MPAGGLGGGLPLAGALHGGGGGPLLRPPHLPLQVGVHNDGTVSRIPRFDTSLIYTNRSPAFEVSRTQNSGQQASPKGEPAGLSFESGAPQMQDFL